MSVNKKATIAVSSIESFKPPLLKVGVRKSFPAYPHSPLGGEARHSNFYIKLPFTA